MALYLFSGQTHWTLWIDLRAGYETGSGIRMINVLAATRAQSDPVSWHNRLAVDLAGPGATKTEIRPGYRGEVCQLNFAYINAKPSPEIEFHIANQARPVIGDSRCRRFFRLTVTGGGRWQLPQIYADRFRGFIRTISACLSPAARGMLINVRLPNVFGHCRSFLGPSISNPEAFSHPNADATSET